MSDVSLARAGIFLKCIFFIGVGIMALIDCIPTLVRRGEYRRLRDNDLMLGHAHRALSENRRLRDTNRDLHRRAQKAEGALARGGRKEWLGLVMKYRDRAIMAERRASALTSHNCETGDAK